ncbi:MAG: exodeoxyribonuclease VII large subunit [Spirochaetales bacterium]|nr:exodeoxyribonuclease VII large subunit [Spirochaetales bacterium]
MVVNVLHFTTVLELTSAIKGLISQNFSEVSVEGEISNFKAASSGHWYFSLKDSHALLQGVMFKFKNSRTGFIPNDGMLVRVYGSLTVYESQGRYQIVVESMVLAGAGKILELIEQRKRILAAEGLFDEERKKTIPLFPRRIGVVTSPTGAAIRDILQVLGRRASGSNIVVLPSAVQGSGATQELVRQIEIANTFHLADVLIIGRGGGSLEDLLPFSEEMVVRAIGRSKIPTISAVGHETDFALSDFVADLRAPTPSVAAELASGPQDELKNRVQSSVHTIVTSLRYEKTRVTSALAPFQPQKLEETFRIYLQPLLQRVDDANDRMLQGIQVLTNRNRTKLSNLTGALEASSPREVLSRGYTIIRDDLTKSILTTSASTHAGTVVEIEFFDGKKRGTIDGKI